MLSLFGKKKIDVKKKGKKRKKMKKTFCDFCGKEIEKPEVKVTMNELEYDACMKCTNRLARIAHYQEWKTQEPDMDAREVEDKPEEKPEPTENEKKLLEKIEELEGKLKEAQDDNVHGNNGGSTPEPTFDEQLNEIFKDYRI